MAGSFSSVALDDAPDIPGLGFRLYRGAADLPAMIAVYASCAQTDQIDPLSSYERVPTLESLQAEYGVSGASLLRQNTLVAEIENAAIGLAALDGWRELDGTRVLIHEELVVPEWRRQGIERAMLRWAEERARQIAAEQGGDGAVVLGANATSAEPERRALLVDQGYQYVFSMVEMELTGFDRLPLATVPPGIAVRHPQPAESRPLWDAIQEAYHGRVMVPALTSEDYAAFAADPRREADLEFVAWDRECVAGAVLARMDRGHGVIDECCVRPAYRRRGLARALMVQALGALRDRQAAMVRLHARQHNETGAQQLYEQLGFVALKEFGRYRKGFTCLSCPGSAM